MNSFYSLDLSSDVGQMSLSWLLHIGQCMKSEDAFGFIDKISDMSDRAFCNLVKSMDATCSDSDEFQFFKHVHDTQSAADYEYESMFINEVPLLGNVESHYTGKYRLQDFFAEKGASDRICLSMNDFQRLFQFWETYAGHKYVHHVPSDLICSNRICMPDMEFCLSGIDDKYDKGYPIVRVKTILGDEGAVFENVKDKLDKSEIKGLGKRQKNLKSEVFDDTESDDLDCKTDVIPVGVIDIPLSLSGDCGFVTSFGILSGLDVLVICDIPLFYGFTDEAWSYMSEHFKESDFIQTTTFFLQVWYTIQVSLNCDVLKKAFSNPVREKDRRKRLSGKACTKIVRPIRVCNVDTASLDDVCKQLNDNHFKLQYLVGGWHKICKSEDEFDVVFIPSGWYRFDETISGPIDWEKFRPEFGTKIYESFMQSKDMSISSDDMLNMLLDVLESHGVANSLDMCV